MFAYEVIDFIVKIVFRMKMAAGDRTYKIECCLRKQIIWLIQSNPSFVFLLSRLHAINQSCFVFRVSYTNSFHMYVGSIMFWLIKYHQEEQIELSSSSCDSRVCSYIGERVLFVCLLDLHRVLFSFVFFSFFCTVIVLTITSSFYITTAETNSLFLLVVTVAARRRLHHRFVSIFSFIYQQGREKQST